MIVSVIAEGQFDGGGIVAYIDCTAEVTGCCLEVSVCSRLKGRHLIINKLISAI